MNDGLYKKVVEHTNMAYACHQVIVDGKGIPVDYRFLETNRSFEEITGLKRDTIINRTVCDVLPGIRDGAFDWVAYFGEIALRGGESEFEQYSKPLDRYYRVKVFSPEKNYFVTLFEDITVNYRLARASHDFLEQAGDVIEYQRITDDLRAISGARYVSFNLFEEDGNYFTTVAVSGTTSNSSRVSGILGYDVTGTRWEHDPERAKKLSGGTTTIFSDIRELPGSLISAKQAEKIEKQLNIGETAIVKIMNDNRMLGDFTVFMGKGKSLKNRNIVETYAQMTGLLIKQQRAKDREAENEQKYRDLVEDSGSVILRLDTEGNILFCNDYAESFFGYTADKLIGNNVVGTIVPEKDSQGRNLAEMMEELTLIPDQYRINENENMKSSGERVWIRWTNRPVFDDNGAFISILCVGQDITDRVQAEKTLASAEGNQRILLDNITTQVWFLTDEHTYGAVNRTHAEFNGTTVEELSFKDMYDLFPEDVVNICREGNREVFSKKIPVYSEEWVPHASGKLRLIGITKTPVLDEKGDVVYVVCSADDITDQRQMEIEINNRLRHEKSLVAISGILASVRCIHGAIDSVLGILREASGASRSYAFVNSESEDGELLMSQVCESVAEGVEPQLDNPELQDLPYSVASPSGELLGQLRAGKVYKVRVADLPDEERPLLEEQGITAILIVPVHIRGIFWGYIGLDNCDETDFFDEQLVYLVKMVADTLGINIDRLQLEDELRTSEQHYRLLAENSSDVIWTTNMELQTTYVSPSVETLVGESVEEHIRRSFDEKFTEESITHLSGILADELEKEKDPACDWNRSRTAEVEHYRADGSIIPVEISMSFLRNENGNIIGIQGISRDITERVRAREQLVQSERKYRLLMESSLYPVVVTSVADQTVLYINQFAARFFGVQPNTATGMKAPDFWCDPRDRDRFMREVGENGAVFAMESRLKTTDGAEMVVLMSTAEIEFEGVPATFTVFSDISERKLLEEKLRASEENFRSFFETVDDIFLIVSTDGYIIYANPVTEKILGYTMEELTGMRILDLHPERLRDDAGEILDAMFRGERDYCPLPLATRNGDYVPVETRVWMGKWDGQDCVFGISKDLTKVQEALQKFQKLFDSNPALMAVSILPERYLVDVNDSFLETLGYERDEVVGRTSVELGIFVEDEMYKQVAHTLEKEGRVNQVQLMVRAKDGSLRDGLFSGEVVESQGKRYLLTVMTDITELSRAQQKIQSLLDDRELLIREVHHRIKNDMATVSSLLGIQSMRSNNSEVKDALDEAKSRILLMGEIYNNLYRRDDVQHVSLISFLSVIVESAKTAQATSIPVDIETNIEDIVVSSKQSFPVGIILNELITNSYKYAFAGKDSGFINVTVARTGEDTMEIVVADNGNGIPEEVIDEKTYGFGLSLVEAYTRQYHGNLEFFSEAGTMVKAVMNIEG